MDNFLEIWYESNITGGHSGTVLQSLLSETKIEGTKITYKCSYIFVDAQFKRIPSAQKNNEHVAAIC
jgi:hypothetical protein